MKKLVCVLIIAGALLPLVGCGIFYIRESPRDFEFYIRWGVWGESSYDSATGELVKTTNATKPADYVTTLKLTTKEYDRVWEIVSGLNMEDYPEYPEAYDPGNGYSKPADTVQLIILGKELSKSIYCPHLNPLGDSEDPAGQAFLDAIEEIRNIIFASEEWQSLPEYEFFYR